MNIFRMHCLIFEWIGLFDSNKFGVKLVYYTAVVAPIALLFPSIAYSMANISDLSKATSAFYITCVILMTHTRYLTYLHHKSLIRSVVNDVMALIDSSVEHRDIYESVHRYSDRLTVCFVSTYFVAITMSMLAPCIVVIFRVANGTYTPDAWMLPTSLIMPFDVNTTPGYEISYLVCVLAAYTIAICSAIEAFIISLSLLMRAAFSDVQIRFRQMDEQIASGRKTKVAQQPIVALKQIVKFHLKLLHIVDDMNALLNEVKYAIFFFGMIILCTAMFQLQENVLNGSQESIQCLAVCACDLIILFVYCCCGEMVSDACDISNTVYQLHWYNYDNQLKYAIRTVIRRTQKSYKFSSCAALNCSLETFAQIVQKAGSAFAMLRSL